MLSNSTARDHLAAYHAAARLQTGVERCEFLDGFTNNNLQHLRRLAGARNDREVLADVDTIFRRRTTPARRVDLTDPLDTATAYTDRETAAVDVYRCAVAGHVEQLRPILETEVWPVAVPRHAPLVGAQAAWWRALDSLDAVAKTTAARTYLDQQRDLWRAVQTAMLWAAVTRAGTNIYRPELDSPRP